MRKKKTRVAAAPLDAFFFLGDQFSSSPCCSRLRFVRFFFHFLLLFVSYGIVLPSTLVCRSTTTARRTRRRRRRRRRMEWYRTKFIKTGSFGPVKHAMVRLLFSISLYLILFLSLVCTCLSLLLLLRGEKILPRLVGPFLFVSVSVSLTFLYARIPLDASLTLFLSLLFSSIDRLERSWSPSG